MCILHSNTFPIAACELCITNITLPDLLIIHSSLSHQIIDIFRVMRHTNITCEQHTAHVNNASELQKLVHKIGIIIESRKAELAINEVLV